MVRRRVLLFVWNGFFVNFGIIVLLGLCEWLLIIFIEIGVCEF